MSPPLTGPSSDSRRPSRTSADSFALAGPSDLPDPTTHAYRRDLADAALAGQVIASHYAEPVERRLLSEAGLRSGPSATAEMIDVLAPGTAFAMLDDSLGWAWGYAGSNRRVGYVETEALTA